MIRDLKSRRLCIVPRVSGLGGMVSFQVRFKRALEVRGATVTVDLKDEPYDAVLVIGGTKQLPDLLRVKRKGIPIIQRLNGMNWIHRRRRTGTRHYLRAEWGNWLLSTIRSRIASTIVYQSTFAQDWWERIYGDTRVPHSVVYNGVDLGEFSPRGTELPPSEKVRLLIVEGRLDGGYEIGLDHALSLSRHLQKNLDLPLELLVVAQASEQLRQKYAGNVGVMLNWAGVISPEDIPSLDRSAHALFSADIHPACPNSVIEAMAVGLPVIAFATGALPEMIQGDSGRIVPYGSDPWKLEDPDFSSLAEAAIEVFQDQERFRLGARAHAVDTFGIERAVQGYLSALEWA